MILSVVVCTCNRSERLPQLFDSMEKLIIPDGMSWELLIVDNGSEDDTWSCLQLELKKDRLPLVCLQQPVPGKSSALNLAITLYRGELVVFTDDDVKPSPGWLKAYFDSARAHPKTLGFMGKVLPLWEGDIPDWLRMDGEFAIPHGIVNLQDFGDSEHVLPRTVIPGGLNTVLRRDAVDVLGKYCEHLGPGTDIPYAEDTEFMRRLYREGGFFIYVPEALIYHINPVERMTREYVKRWSFEVARCQILAFKGNATANYLSGIPRYLFRQAAERWFGWFLEPRLQQRFLKNLKLQRTLGEISGYRDLAQIRKGMPHNSDRLGSV